MLRALTLSLHALIAASLLLAAPVPAVAQEVEADVRTVRLTSLEWPPYSGKDLPQQGASIAVVRAALAAMGHRLEVEFVPWTQAVALGQDGGSGFHGYLPEYTSPEIEHTFQLSREIGRSPLGFVERQSAPVRWQTLTDLREERIGVVRGYINTQEFDARVARGELNAVPASDDLTNVRKVMTGRLPLAVIDRHVLAYLMQHERSVTDARHVLQFNARLLEEKSLHVAVQRSPRGDWTLKIINAGLQRIDANAIAAPFFREQR